MTWCHHETGRGWLFDGQQTVRLVGIWALCIFMCNVVGGLEQFVLFSFTYLGMSSSQLTNSYFLQRGTGIPPTSDWFSIISHHELTSGHQSVGLLLFIPIFCKIDPSLLPTGVQASAIAQRGVTSLRGWFPMAKVLHWKDRFLWYISMLA